MISVEKRAHEILSKSIIMRYQTQQAYYQFESSWPPKLK